MLFPLDFLSLWREFLKIIVWRRNQPTSRKSKSSSSLSSSWAFSSSDSAIRLLTSCCSNVVKSILSTCGARHAEVCEVTGPDKVAVSFTLVTRNGRNSKDKENVWGSLAYPISGSPLSGESFVLNVDQTPENVAVSTLECEIVQIWPAIGLVSASTTQVLTVERVVSSPIIVRLNRTQPTPQTNLESNPIIRQLIRNPDQSTKQAGAYKRRLCGPTWGFPICEKMTEQRLSLNRQRGGGKPPFWVCSSEALADSLFTRFSFLDGLSGLRLLVSADELTENNLSNWTWRNPRKCQLNVILSSPLWVAV